MRALNELVQVRLGGARALLRPDSRRNAQPEQKTRDRRENRAATHCGQGNARSMYQGGLVSLDDLKRSATGPLT